MSERIRCKACGADMGADQLDRDLAVARCEACGAVFGLAPGDDGPARPLRPRAEMPKGMDVLDIGQAIQITWRWFGPAYIGLLFFCILWNGFMVGWHGIALSEGAWIMSAFGLVHTAVGVAVAYVTLAGFLNRTTIRAGGGVLEIHHAPLPWPNNHLQFEAADLRQLYVKQKIHRGNQGRTHRSYELYALDRNDTRRKLLSGLYQPEQALYLEQELERFLGLTDEKVPGAYTG